MAVFPRPAHPRVLLADLRTFLVGDRHYKLVFATLAIGMTSLIFTAFILETRHGVLPEGDHLTYVEDFSNTRTDAQIIAQQNIDQKIRDAALSTKRAEFQKVDDALTRLGI
jgi:hypothetical protein